MRSAGGHRDRGFFKSIDWRLVICYLLLVFIGWVNIYASVHSSDPASIFDWTCRSGKQAVWMGTAFIIAIVVLLMNPRIYESLAVPIYLFVGALLVAVIFLGIDVKGSSSWFEFGPVRFQPAEISKISTSLMLAAYMSQQGYRISRMRNFIVTALIILIPMAIIVLQSETGSALVYVGFIFMLYREGLSGWLIFLAGMAILSFILTLTASPFVAILVIVGIASLCICLYSDKLKWWFFICVPAIVLMAFVPSILAGFAEEGLKLKPLHILLGVIGLAIPPVIYWAYKERNTFSHLAIVSTIAGILLVFSADFIFNDVLQDHQRKRIEVLLGMKEDPAGVGYNVRQSKIAIGSGGMFGKGYLNGTQTTYGFVPEQSTDFIFCTIGEEWGFAGSAAVILLYVFLIWRIIRDAEQSREAFTRIYGYCVACCIFMHLFINIGMTIGLMPVIGIPLPLISYGGSSLWGFTALIFIFIALYRNEKKYF
ncbi:MAG: rod shape-determining protein RodA [Bacteroidales bacterium]|nr:rod shape-determining protein RodA [Bacteroidales bacterium]MBR5809828.1 rod shape-determining protein RodA [Bacteroidales bacterium]